jgi:hypothetical protein
MLVINVLCFVMFFLNTVCFGQCTGITFVNSTKIAVCHNKRIKRNRFFKSEFRLLSKNRTCVPLSGNNLTDNHKLRFALLEIQRFHLTLQLNTST